VFNISHIELVSFLPLTCSPSTHTVSFHSGLFPSRRERGMLSAPIQRHYILQLKKDAFTALRTTRFEKLDWGVDCDS
jgi:hypothetical protein